MTGIHRLPAGAEHRASGLVRPALVIADPEAMTSQDEAAAARQLDERARARRRLPLHALRQPGLADVGAARGGADRRRPRPGPRESRDRAGLALGSILCGYAIDSALFALHHVICQTLVRVCGSPARGDQRRDPAARRWRSCGERAPQQTSPTWPPPLGTDARDAAASGSASSAGRRGLGDAGADRDQPRRGARRDRGERPSSASRPTRPAARSCGAIVEAAW